MLFRVIIAIVVTLAVLALLRRIAATIRPPEHRQAIEAKMARCAKCGVYYPREDGVTRGGLEYCSSAHAAADGGGR